MTLKFAKSLLLIASIIWLSDACCPDQWFRIVGIQDKCFRFYGTPRRWHDALHVCRSQSGSLVSIHSYTESYNIFQVWKTLTGGSTSIREAYWIGLSDHIAEGNFRWADGSWKDFTTWRSGEPNNYQGGEDCVQVYNDGRNDGDRMEWNDHQCDRQNSFFCQKPLDR